jgi:hypothetical protein
LQKFVGKLGNVAGYLDSFFFGRYNAYKRKFILSTMSLPTHHDSDTAKGAVEQETPQPGVNNPYIHGQLGHRDPDEDLKDNDSDFPEPGAREEHSGEHK